MLIKLAVICSIIYLANATTCMKNLNALAESQTKFLHCIIHHSVPVTMCVSCKTEHDHVLEAYDTLANNCSNDYFDRDRINLIPLVENELTDVWSKAYCDDCFNDNNVFEFNNKSKDFYNCLDNFKTNSCEFCQTQYLYLNSFYINLDQHNNGEVCFDLQDSINRTRNKWSKELKCCHRARNMTLFAITLGFTAILPLVFYGTSYLITKRQERNHVVLNDEDPLFNSSLPSTSRHSNMNNAYIQTQSLNDNCISNTAYYADPTASKSVQETNRFDILNDNLSSSDDEILTNDEVVIKEKIK